MHSVVVSSLLLLLLIVDSVSGGYVNANCCNNLCCCTTCQNDCYRQTPIGYVGSCNCHLCNGGYYGQQIYDSYGVAVNSPVSSKPFHTSSLNWQVYPRYSNLPYQSKPHDYYTYNPNYATSAYGYRSLPGAIPSTPLSHSGYSTQYPSNSYANPFAYRSSPYNTYNLPSHSYRTSPYYPIGGQPGAIPPAPPSITIPMAVPYPISGFGSGYPMGAYAQPPMGSTSTAKPMPTTTASAPPVPATVPFSESLKWNFPAPIVSHSFPVPHRMPMNQFASAIPFPTSTTANRFPTQLAANFNADPSTNGRFASMNHLPSPFAFRQPTGPWQRFTN